MGISLRQRGKDKYSITNIMFTVYDISTVQTKGESTRQNHYQSHTVSSLCLNQLPENKIISGSLLQLQETVGQGIYYICFNKMYFIIS